MSIKTLAAAQNRAKELEKQVWRLQAKIYDFASQLEDAGLLSQQALASEAGFEMDITQQKLKQIFD